MKYYDIEPSFYCAEGNRILYARLGWNSTTTPSPPGTFGNPNDMSFHQPSYNVPTQAPLAQNVTCERNGWYPFMGTFVSDAAPYLFPVVIEYSLIAAAVAFIIWRNIGRGVPTKS